MKSQNGILVIFLCTDRRFDLNARRAAEQGRQAIVDTGCRVDPDQNLCAVQMESMAAGYTKAIIDSNIYGFCVRDTNNNGGGRLSPNFKTAVEALDWAREWYSEKPALREVICYPAFQETLKAELRKVKFQWSIVDRSGELVAVEPFDTEDEAIQHKQFLMDHDPHIRRPIRVVRVEAQRDKAA